jgi:uncharacterized protein (TIGR00725 family)
MVAHHGMTLITGGGGGVMEAACRGAKNAGGITVGIIQSDRAENANPHCSIVIPSGMGHGRNILTVLSGDVIIALGGGAGTLTELGFSWIHGKPILTLAGHGGWAGKTGGRAIDERRPDTVIACRDLTDMERELLGCCRRLALIFT